MSKYIKKDSRSQGGHFLSRDQEGQFGCADKGFGQTGKGVRSEMHSSANSVGADAAKESAVTWELSTANQLEYVDPHLYESGFFKSLEEREKLLASTLSRPALPAT